MEFLVLSLGGNSSIQAARPDAYQKPLGAERERGGALSDGRYETREPVRRKIRRSLLSKKEKRTVRPSRARYGGTITLLLLRCLEHPAVCLSSKARQVRRTSRQDWDDDDDDDTGTTMSSFFAAAIRLALRRRPHEGHMSEERAQSIAAAVRPPAEPALAPAAEVPAAQARGASNSLVPGSDSHRSVYLNPEEDPLTFFRLMLGIQTSPYLGFTISSPLGTRPAANLGLYARVVHSEQKAKDSFRVFSVVINGCYFLQIVVAAALTALGAARASSGAVTAFGAINTVIAGLLTFLKGSGLPGRLKYYGNEWKKIREFIEQRERDFMRSGGHDLDVYEVVETIEKMYNNLKADIELNTPDSYTSVTNQRRVGDDANRIGGIDMSKLESLASKLKGFEAHGGANGGANGKLEGLAAGLAKRAEGVARTMQQHEKDAEAEIQHFREDVVRDVQGHKARLDREAGERGAKARAAVSEGKQAARDGAGRLDAAVEGHRARALETVTGAGRAAQEGVGAAAGLAAGSVANLAHDLAHELGEIHQTAVSGGRQAAAQQIRNLARRLGGHDDNHADDDDDDDDDDGRDEEGGERSQGKPGPVNAGKKDK
ncbi:hypothetical protein F4802DRAFT_615283 [Xylaria palmicola]|nr:hypothetical protein F4802DRAFT_615283 [Xylaria palmicola]